MPDWPWDETREQRRTRIAHLYRDALWEAAPHACYDLDATLDSYGQHWITGNYPPINTNEPMTAAEIARWQDLSVNSITNRIAERGIKPAGHRGRRKTYRLEDFTPHNPDQQKNIGVISAASSPCPKTILRANPLHTITD